MRAILILVFLPLYGICQNTAPGGVFSNLELWLKADHNTSCSTDGCQVTNWTDSSTPVVETLTSGLPRFTTNSINYNPAIVFLGGGDYVRERFNQAGNGQFDVFSVFRQMGGTGPAWTHNNSDSFNGFFPSFGNSGRFLAKSTDAWDSESPTDFPINTTYLASGFYELNNIQLRKDGEVVKNTGLNSISENRYGFGKRFDDYFIGHVAEIIFYEVNATGPKRHQIESYLALKYGVTLDNSAGTTAGDYASSDGSLIWDASDNSGYHNNVIGIGRDDISALSQKQSKTIDDITRLFIGELAIDNISNTTAFNNDTSYIILGDNQGMMAATTSSNAEMPTGLAGCTLSSRLEREWKVTKTNITNTVTLSITATPTSQNSANLRLLVDDDGDFSNGGTTCYFNGDAFGTVISYSDPSISISSISTSHIPNNSTRYITIAESATLPIELLNFNARLINNEKVQLYWQTASEVNNDYFTIERSINGYDWDIVSTVDGGGNSSTILTYSTVVDNISDGVSYYRLKQTDFDGQFEYSNVRSVNIKARDNLQIFPNPTNSKIAITGSAATLSEITIYNTLGQNVTALTQQIINNDEQIVIDLSDLNSGIYYVKTKTTVDKIYKQ